MPPGAGPPHGMAPGTTQTDTALEYGLFLLIAHPNLVINDFLFWTDVNNTDVFGPTYVF